jgi:hypothetical protein
MGGVLKVMGPIGPGLRAAPRKPRFESRWPHVAPRKPRFESRGFVFPL